MYHVDTNDYNGNGNMAEFLPFYYHENSRGDVTMLTDAIGQVAETYSYDEFGKTTIFDRLGVQVQASSVGNPYMFQGRAHDSETGLYDYRARTYSPSIGRFFQADPLGYIDGMNLLAFVRHDPINYRDPSGLVKVKVDCPGEPKDEDKDGVDDRLQKFVDRLNKDLHRGGEEQGQGIQGRSKDRGVEVGVQ